MRRTSLFAVLVLGALSVACSDNKGGGGVFGGGSEAVGTWTIDWDATMPSFLPPDTTPEMREMMKPMLEQMKAMKVEIRVDGNGTFTGQMPSGPGKTETIKGTWKKVDGGIELRGTEKDGKAIPADDKDARPITVKVEGGKMRLSDPENPQMVLVFKKA
jgi:hypothetical protein